MLVNEARKEAEFFETARDGKDDKDTKDGNLAQVLCIRYPITFRKNFLPLSALLDSSSEINVIHLSFEKEIDLSIIYTTVRE